MCKKWRWPHWMLSVVGLFFLAVVFLFPFLARARENPRKSSCQSNLRQIGLSLAQYTQDYGDRYPPRATKFDSFGWADALLPYSKSTQIYQCPNDLDKGQTNPRWIGFTDYYFNANWARMSLVAVNNPATTIILAEGNDGLDKTDARYAKTAIPSAWFRDTNSPLYRHNEWASDLFADGHVKAVRAVDLRRQLDEKQLIY